MMRRISIFILLTLFLTGSAWAAISDPEQLYTTLRTKVLAVHDYTANVKMKVDVSYMRIPVLHGKLYFKAPDKMRLERNGGISILPKKNVNLTLSNLIPTGKVTVIDAGSAVIDGKKTRILKVVPEDDHNGIILTKIWIDEVNLLAMRTETTTQNDGTVIMSLEYGKYTSYALPDKVIIYMDLKDYKLPKGVAMDYNDVQAAPATTKKIKNQKGTIEIRYLDYMINSGLSDAVFLKKEA